VDVGSVPSGVAINPDGTKVYVTNYYSNTVSVIDTSTNTVTATVDTGDCPNGITVSPDGKKVYVANGVSYPSNKGTVSVIDSTTNTVTATVSIGSYPSDIAVTPDGKYVYMAEINNATVSVIDTSTNAVTAIVHVRLCPDGVAVSPDGEYVYVANSDSNMVFVIDTSTNTVTDSVDVGSIPVDIAITSDGKKVYVTNYESQEVSVIDTSTNTVTATVPVGLWINKIAISQFPESPQTALPVANFTSNVTEGNAPLNIQFTDLSENATEWSWDFDNDGTIDSTEQSPSYTYSSAGNYSVNLAVSNDDGSDSEVKTDYIVVSTPEIQDTTAPVIQSVVLFPANITAGSSININVNVTDDTDVTEVKVGGIIQLTKIDGIWQGIIETPSSNSVGNYPLKITANDAAGNTAETSVLYHVVKLTGGANIGVSPRSNSITAGNTASLSIKVKNTQNIDDTFKVCINVSEVPASYRADLSWFNWTEKVVTLRAGEEVLIPMEVTVPDGTAAGRKLFRAKVNSETSSITGFDTGYLVIS
jgi:YVTN family beta-propeller protein